MACISAPVRSICSVRPIQKAWSWWQRHGLFERWLVGSVARQVIAYAPCAVTVVRPHA
ncbi:MAG: universal stress protein [Pseudomonadota bacterium]